MLRREAQETPPFQLTLAGVMHKSPAISHNPEQPSCHLTATKVCEAELLSRHLPKFLIHRIVRYKKTVAVLSH